MVRDPPGDDIDGYDQTHEWELMFLLGMSFQLMMREFVARMDDAGYSELRPIHGLVFQSISAGGATNSKIAQDIGVTKQAASQTLNDLEAWGYVERVDHPEGGRRRLVVLSAKGLEHFAAAGRLLGDLEKELAERLPGEGMPELRERLRQVIGVLHPEGTLPALRLNY